MWLLLTDAQSGCRRHSICTIRAYPAREFCKIAGWWTRQSNTTRVLARKECTSPGSVQDLDITPEELKGRNQRSALQRELDQRRRRQRHAPSAMTPRNSKTTTVIATGPLNCGSKPIARRQRLLATGERSEHVRHFAEVRSAVNLPAPRSTSLVSSSTIKGEQRRRSYRSPSPEGRLC
jgi:hypothetical protein